MTDLQACGGACPIRVSSPPKRSTIFFCLQKNSSAECTPAVLRLLRGCSAKCYVTICTITSISTVMPLGSDDIPTADRA